MLIARFSRPVRHDADRPAPDPSGAGFLRPQGQSRAHPRTCPCTVVIRLPAADRRLSVSEVDGLGDGMYPRRRDPDEVQRVVAGASLRLAHDAVTAAGVEVKLRVRRAEEDCLAGVPGRSPGAFVSS